MVPVYSTTKFDGKSVNLDANQIAQTTADVRNYWKPLRELKGASVFGAAKHSYDIVKAIVKNEKLRIPASVMVKGEYGLSGICIGIPVIIDRNGATIEEIDLNDQELNSLKKSSEIIKNNIEKI